MNKQELNNEIILCRPAVRKAKVIVIRKILKKMKILKSCKSETLKEKKLKKSERLFKKIQLMKKAKLDDVTKFALRNSNLQSYLQEPKAHLKENVLACLAKHEAVATKIKLIRERFQNWEMELPILLDSMGKKKKLAKNANKKTEKPTKQSDKDIKSDGNSVSDTLKKSKVCMAKIPVKPDMKPPKNFKDGDKHKVKSNDNSLAKDISVVSPKPKKIDDPFFIDKKVIQPKLHAESLPSGKSNEGLEKLKCNNALEFQKNIFKLKKDLVPLRTQKLKSQPLEDQLHPSWAAKKVKLIKPFEGKKIVFSEE